MQTLPQVVGKDVHPDDKVSGPGGLAALPRAAVLGAAGSGTDTVVTVASVPGFQTQNGLCTMMPALTK